MSPGHLFSSSSKYSSVEEREKRTQFPNNPQVPLAHPSSLLLRPPEDYGNRNETDPQDLFPYEILSFKASLNRTSHDACLVVIKVFHQNAVHTEIAGMEFACGNLWEIVSLWVIFVLHVSDPF